ncbi:MAG: Ig-like domain-containing protein [Flavobacteriales bacterium]|nr:Ig-like domain-containing protein [Flavobacteriales bacterium]
MYYRPNFLTFLFAFASVIFFAGCAQMVAPKGGDKDIAPPVALSFKPENKTTNYLPKKPLEIEFDEYVKIESALKNIIISPPIDEKLEVFRTGKKVVVKIKSELDPNTTYCIKYGDAIKDITENNVLSNLEYVISTGAVIDSAKISGVVRDALTDRPVKDIQVYAYSNNEDSIPYKSIPSYYAVTNDSGLFEISYMRQGAYKIFALKDDNRNMIFDIPSEYIGYAEGMVEANDSSIIEIVLFQEDYELQSTHKIINRGDKYVVPFNRPTENLTLSGNNILDNYWNQEKDSLTFWMESNRPDTILIKLSDSPFQDTIYLIRPKEIEVDTSIEQYLNVSAKLGKRGRFEFFEEFYLRFPELVYEYDVNLLALLEDTNIIPINIVKPSRPFFENLQIDNKWKTDTKYSLTALPGAFKTKKGLSNDSITIRFMTKDSSYYSTVNIILQGGKDNQNYFATLADKKGGKLGEVNVTGNDTITFNNLAKGNYELKLTYDSNNNQKWDTGDYMDKKQPEKTITLSGGIETKEGFETELIWEIE